MEEKTQYKKIGGKRMILRDCNKFETMKKSL